MYKIEEDMIFISASKIHTKIKTGNSNYIAPHVEGRSHFRVQNKDKSHTP